jgi:hypothetical protein
MKPALVAGKSLDFTVLILKDSTLLSCKVLTIHFRGYLDEERYLINSLFTAIQNACTVVPTES